MRGRDYILATSVQVMRQSAGEAVHCTVHTSLTGTLVLTSEAVSTATCSRQAVT